MSKAYGERRAGKPARAGAAAGVLAAALAALVCLALPGGTARADSPFAPVREYDLQNARIELRFDVNQRKVIGHVTHTLSALQAGLQELDFDAVELKIASVEVNGAPAKFSSDSNELHVNLDRPTNIGAKYQVAISYEGTPKKGLYFVLPDASDPTQPKEVWTQGEAEDTRYYLPIYDYPNNRETTEMIVTVPRDWVTVSNGTLESVTDTADGQKTWTWRQSQPISSYLISLVAGEFDGVKQTWGKLPVEFYVPRGQRDRIPATFAHTNDMLAFFSQRLDVPYPWDKYDQTSVDQFTEGGMENVSATTLTIRGLLNPTLAKESFEGSDGLTSHEMSHQWFGDLVTCKDWSNLWLNEGFATFMARMWEEHEYGPDAAAYGRWRERDGWLRQARLFGVPIVTGDFKDSMAYAGNIYDKGGLVLEMLRRQMGDQALFAGLKHYLEANRMSNVVTADLIKALEESSHQNLEKFFDQWVYGAGAPKFSITSNYDAGMKQVRLEVRQTQEVRGRVGLFEVPVVVEITTASGARSFPITVSRAQETFTFPVDSAPLMVLFDKGDELLKTVDFRKQPGDWIYQLQNAKDTPDRAIAAVALGALKSNDAAAAALGQAALHDRYWGIRVEALNALGRIGGPEAERHVVAALANSDPWVRDVAATQLSHFHDDGALIPRLSDMARNDSAYRVRVAALGSLATLKAPGTLETLDAAVKADSPDDIIRRAALRGMGTLGDDKSVPVLLSWAGQGQPVRIRATAIGAISRLDRKNSEIEAQLLAYLRDPNYDIRIATLFALADRGDKAAVAPLEEALRSGEPYLGNVTEVQRVLDRLKRGDTQHPEGE